MSKRKIGRVDLSRGILQPAQRFLLWKIISLFFNLVKRFLRLHRIFKYKINNMKIQEIKNPTQAQYDWADLNMFRLERKAIKDYVVNVETETGGQQHLLSVVCQAILFNFSFDELSKKGEFPNV